MKFTLISQHDVNETKITYEFRAEGLNTVLENIEQFLKAGGFFFDGSLYFIDDKDEYYTSHYKNQIVTTSPDEQLITGNLDDSISSVHLNDEKFLNLNYNMSTSWPFPFDRPNETTPLTPEK